METGVKTYCHTIAEWEGAIKGNDEITFEEMYLSNGFVVMVTGYVIYENRKYTTLWIYDGTCTSSMLKVDLWSRYDIILQGYADTTD